MPVPNLRLLPASDHKKDQRKAETSITDRKTAENQEDVEKVLKEPLFSCQQAKAISCNTMWYVVAAKFSKKSLEKFFQESFHLQKS